MIENLIIIYFTVFGILILLTVCDFVVYVFFTKGETHFAPKSQMVKARAKELKMPFKNIKID